MQEIKDRLLTIMREQFGDSITDSAAEGEDVFVDHGRGWADGSLDSLDKVEFIMAVEDDFSIEIPDYQVTGFKTLDDVATFIDALTRGPVHGAH